MKTIQELAFPNLERLINAAESARAKRLQNLAAIHRKQRALESGAA